MPRDRLEVAIVVENRRAVMDRGDSDEAVGDVPSHPEKPDGSDCLDSLPKAHLVGKQQRLAIDKEPYTIELIWHKWMRPVERTPILEGHFERRREHGS